MLVKADQKFSCGVGGQGRGQTSPAHRHDTRRTDELQINSKKII